MARIPTNGDPEPPHDHFVQECPPASQLPPDYSAETLILHLNGGILEDVRSEFPLPGSPLVSFRRVLVALYVGYPLAFGVGGTDNADKYLTTGDGMRHLRLREPDSTALFVRRPLYLPLLAFNTWVPAYAHLEPATIRWVDSPESFKLLRSDGSSESYLPCTDREYCLLQQTRDTHGVTTLISRDAERKLTALQSSGGAALTFAYDSKRISRITDPESGAIAYTYNSAGRLESATYPDGSRTVVHWTGKGQIASVGTSAGANEPVRERVHAEYMNGRIASEVFSTDAAFRFAYSHEAGGPSSVIVTGPGGAPFTVALSGAPLYRD